MTKTLCALSLNTLLCLSVTGLVFTQTRTIVSSCFLIFSCRSALSLGSQLWGQDNAVVGRWPVVVVENGKARIKEFRSVSGWLDKHTDVLIKHMKELGLRTV